MSQSPLAGLKVLDLTEGVAGPFCTKLLADFGADVIKVERPGLGDWSRHRAPFFGDQPDPEHSLLFAYLNTNKRSLTLDLDHASGQQAVRDLCRSADILVEGWPADYLQERGLDPGQLRADNRRLVVTSIPLFARQGPYRHYRATELNLYAMSGLMSIVGGIGHPPLKAGGYQAQYMAGLQACAFTLFGAYQARTTGEGCWIETSVLETCAKILEHMIDYTVEGAAARSPDERRAHGNYVQPCGDGYVTITLYYFQMQTLAKLLGNPAIAHDSRFASEVSLRQNEAWLRSELSTWLGRKTAEEAQTEGQSQRLLVTRVNSTRDLLENSHLQARHFFVATDSPVMGRAVYPGPPFRFTASPPLLPQAAPRLGEANDDVLGSLRSPPSPQPDQDSAERSTAMPKPGTLPLAGVRVLDLTHRLAGPTLTMFLGDWGAEVIKIEWWYRMDAWRGMISIEHDVDGQQAYNKKPNWLKLNRNKRGMTLNLKSEKGKDLFLQLVEKSDLVVENFSANVMQRLGLGHEVLSRVNPRIIMISLPGFGNNGPHAAYVSNGATIEGYAGLASLTGYEDGIPRNSVGIWPDPVAGINGAVAVAMALLWRHKTGKGQYIELSQAEALTTLLGEAVLDYTVNGRVQAPLGNGDLIMAPHGCYPCQGEDAWVTIAVASDAEWQALCQVAAHADWLQDKRFGSQQARHQHRHELDKLLQAWTREYDRWELTQRLQQAGVAATPVLTREDFEGHAGLPAEDFYQYLEHAHLSRYPGAAARLDGHALPLRYPPPRLGEHNEDMYRDLLGLGANEVAQLHEQGVI